MLYREVIAICSHIHTEHINTLCGQNVEYLHVKPGWTHFIHPILKGSNVCTFATHYNLAFREIFAKTSIIIPKKTNRIIFVHHEGLFRLHREDRSASVMML